MDVLLKWNQKPIDQKAYNNFKIHMRKGYHELREVGALSIQDSTLNYANMVKDVTEHQERMAKDIKDSLSDQLNNSLMEALMVSQNHPVPAPDDTSSLSTPSINSASSDATIASLVTIIKKLEAKVDSLSKQTGNNTNNNNNSTTTNDTINPRTGKKWRRYC